MDRLDAMQLFVRVAELGSFSAAAQQLGLARSVVTRQIAALENHLRIKLMARSTRKLTLTSAGASYLEKCRVILNLVEVAETDLASERHTPRGNIRIGLPLSFGLKRLAPLLRAFARQNPELRIDMDFTDRKVNLIEEGFDLSIRITARLEPGDIVRKLGECRLLAVASADYLARHGTPAHPAELNLHECLGYSGDGVRASWEFEAGGQRESIYVHSRLSANNGDVIAAAAAEGMGITVQPDFIVAPYLEDGRLQAILPDHALPRLGIYALMPSNRHLPHRVRILIDYLAAELAR